MIEAQLTASGFQLELYVDGYELPEFDTGRDANTLVCEIELDLRQGLDLHAAHGPLILDAVQLTGFVDQLARSNTPTTARRLSETQTQSQAMSSA